LASRDGHGAASVTGTARHIHRPAGATVAKPGKDLHAAALITAFTSM
jgi:hypothetical protein